MPGQPQSKQRPRSINPASVNSRGNTNFSTGRPERPLIVRGSGERPSWPALVAVVGLLAIGVWGGESRLGLPEVAGVFSVKSSATSAIQISNVTLEALRSFKGRTQWRVSGRAMNSGKEVLAGPRLQVQLLRGDGSVAAERIIDYTDRTLPEYSGVQFSQELETSGSEALRANVMVLPVRPGDAVRNESNE